MKVICPQQKLNWALAAVLHAISNRSTLPILANMLLATEGGRLKIGGTNLEIGITCWVEEAQVLEEGTTTVPARLFAEFVSSLPAGPVELSVPPDSHTMKVTGLRSSSNMKGLDPAEFPQIPGNESGEPSVQLEATLLKEIIAEVAFASADDDSRPVLTGVLVQVSEENISFAAADAFRLALREADLPANDHPCGNMLIPARTLTELARILPGEGPVEMIVTPNRSQVLFHTASMDLVSRLIEGTFPNFRAIIPKETGTRVVVNTKEFASAVKSASLFAKDSSNIVRMKICPPASDHEAGALIIEAASEDLGDNVSTLQATVEGHELQVTCNVKYLTDALSAIATSEVVVQIISATKPIVIKPADQKVQNYVVMPMHVNK